MTATQRQLRNARRRLAYWVKTGGWRARLLRERNRWLRSRSKQERKKA